MSLVHIATVIKLTHAIRVGGVFGPEIVYLEVLDGNINSVTSSEGIWPQQCLHSPSHIPHPSPPISCLVEM